MSTIKEHFGLGTPGVLARFNGNRQFISGIEYEIEAIKSLGSLPSDGRLEIVDDHSLRNNGKEIRTIPLTFDEQLETFKFIHSQLKLGKDPFSERTSIHVHVNVRELEMSTVRQLILTYALLEPLFFEYVGDVRKSSIFCVPLNYTHLPSIYKLPIQKLVEMWHKYTAFNILPMATFGTVEFRHMYGTADLEMFVRWLTALKELYTFIERQPTFDLIAELEKGLSTADLAKAVIPSLVPTWSTAKIKEVLEDSLLDVKLSVGGLK